MLQRARIDGDKGDSQNELLKCPVSKSVKGDGQAAAGSAEHAVEHAVEHGEWVKWGRGRRSYMNSRGARSVRSVRSVRGMRGGGAAVRYLTSLYVTRPVSVRAQAGQTQPDTARHSLARTELTEAGSRSGFKYLRGLQLLSMWRCGHVVRWVRVRGLRQ